MNDPGLDEPIQQSAAEAQQDLRHHLQHSRAKGHLREELLHGGNYSDDDRFQPKRWWFMSTAFPLIAGTFGPLVNLMSVCSLVQTWRVKFKENGAEGLGERVADPRWLLGLNAVSLACAVGANVLLLLSFAQRVGYRVGVGVTTVLWYIASVILIVLVITASETMPLPSNEYAFSQSFYYGMICAVLYFIIAALLSISLFGSLHLHAYPPTLTTLSVPQRTLMLQTIAYSFYLALGAGIFAALENWSYTDGIYFTHYTLVTVALGSDFAPSHTASRILLIPYAFFGIMIVGLIVSSIRTLFLERVKSRFRLRALDQERQDLTKDRTGSREHNFYLMRHTQRRAERQRKLMSLSSCLFVGLFLWLMGALVFYYAERHRPQKWGYWDAVYFCYLCLLTIGFGDLFPQSMAGRPWFVVWSMAAVPTMTVLISSMGDTVVRWVKEVTLWIGRNTVLPENKGQAEREEKAGVERREEVEGERLEVRLVREMRRVARDVGKKEGREYAWERWSGWLELLGVGEEDAEWSWVGDQGPLMSGVSEAEWVLRRLGERLEEVLAEEKEDK